MVTENRIFEKTYKDYLSQIGRMDLSAVAEKVGLDFVDNNLIIPLLGERLCVSYNGIYDSSGGQPGFDVCVILFRYVLMSMDDKPDVKGWTAFRDLKNSGPLETYFSNDVEAAIKNSFTGKLQLLQKTIDSLQGTRPSMELNYDLATEVVLLPGLPVIIIFNDADAEFPASCSVLFDSNAESWLDAESLAILGLLLVAKLKKLASL